MRRVVNNTKREEKMRKKGTLCDVMNKFSFTLYISQNVMPQSPHQHTAAFVWGEGKHFNVF